MARPVRPGRLAGLETWFTLDEAAELCKRSPGTIRNLISKHQLPVQRLWLVVHRRRFRRVHLSLDTVCQLRALTLEAGPRRRATDGQFQRP